MCTGMLQIEVVGKLPELLLALMMYDIMCYVVK